MPIIGDALKKAEDAVKAAATAAKETAEKAVVAAKETAEKGVDWAAENTTAGRAIAKTAEVAKEAGAAAKAAYAEKVSPGTNPPSPAPNGMINKAASAVGGAAGGVVAGVKSLSTIIAGGESGKEGYDAYNRGTGLGPTGHRNISGMTIDEISAAQKLDTSDKNRLMAVGKYQMMPTTLAEGAKSLGMSGGTKFDENTQEKLYTDYLVGKKRPEIKDYITGKSTDAQAAQIAMAKEWRSIADPRTGQTFADKGAAGNKASVTADQALLAMDDSAKRYQQNLASGMGEQESYRKAVAPLQSVTKNTGTETALAQANDPSAYKAGGALSGSPAAPVPVAPADRYAYKDLGNNQIGVTDKETGVSELASEEQARAYRISEGKAYKDQLAQANDPSAYKAGGALSGSPAAPALSVAPASPVVASVKIPNISVAPAPAAPALSDAPPVITPLASFEGRTPPENAQKSPDAGQDVKDRRIAHIATGGMSA